MKDVKAINEKLREYQKEWLNYIKGRLSEESYSMLANPFYFGISEDYCNSKDKKIMVVGQEVRLNEKDWAADKAVGGWGFLNNSFDGNCEHGIDALTAKLNEQIASQLWTTNNCDAQLNRDPAKSWKRLIIEGDEIKEADISKDSGCFWDLMRKLNDNGIKPCWNNVDKILYNVIDTKENKIKMRRQTKEEESVLSGRYGPENKSLLEREIEILLNNKQLDALLFACGPSYCVSLESAFDKSCATCKPNYYTKRKKGDLVVEVTDSFNFGIPVFWSYHPNFYPLRSAGQRGVMICKIKSKINDKLT